MKTIIRTVAKFIEKLFKIAWYEVPATKKAIFTSVFKAVNGSFWEVTAQVKGGAIKTVAIQGLLFNA